MTTNETIKALRSALDEALTEWSKRCDDAIHRARSRRIGGPMTLRSAVLTVRGQTFARRRAILLGARGVRVWWVQL